MVAVDVTDSIVAVCKNLEKILLTGDSLSLDGSRGVTVVPIGCPG